MATTTTFNEKDPRAGDLNAPAQQARPDRARPSSRYLKLKRLPTLQEVLDRRTRPPLDLFCFYVRRRVCCADTPTTSCPNKH